ncbi:hypothetical protein MAPG_09448 [Magnaporthiopsis poae ATCC 64411]|uniref:Fucose-specific lectin n=1 Tax=Magnaporthiopsis poae (strain ATCC 64411 / 73-15) TaxID=644358 RepID=A0A0C4E9Z6_MAGP6|nr:hypothetical protein MAPG_09448 [Magnaporthiopsis poae ATCC 64411]
MDLTASPELAVSGRSAGQNSNTIIRGPDQSSPQARASISGVWHEEHSSDLQVEGDRPGLETAPVGEIWPERFVPDHSGPIHIVRDDKMAADGSQCSGKGEDKGKTRKKGIRKILLCGLVTWFIVGAAILGGVFGSRSINGSQSINGTAAIQSQRHVALTESYQLSRGGSPHLEIFAADSREAGRFDSILSVRRNFNATSPTDFMPRLKSEILPVIEAAGARGSLLQLPAHLRFSVQPAQDGSSNWTEIVLVDRGLLRLGRRSSNTDWDFYDVTQPANNDSREDYQASAAPKESVTLLPSAAGRSISRVLFLTSSSNGLQMAYCGISRGDRSYQGARIFSSTGLALLSPRAVDFGDDLHVFGVAQDTRHLLHGVLTQKDLAKSPGGLNMKDAGGYVTTTPAVVSRGPCIEVFARGGDGRLWWKTYNGSSPNFGWGGVWTRVDGNVDILGEPDAISWTEDRVDIFAWGGGPGNSLLHRTFTFSGRALVAGELENLSSPLELPAKIPQIPVATRIYRAARAANRRAGDWEPDRQPCQRLPLHSIRHRCQRVLRRSPGNVISWRETTALRVWGDAKQAATVCRHIVPGVGLCLRSTTQQLETCCRRQSGADWALCAAGMVRSFVTIISVSSSRFGTAEHTVEHSCTYAAAGGLLMGTRTIRYAALVGLSGSSGPSGSLQQLSGQLAIIQRQKMGLLKTFLLAGLPLLRSHDARLTYAPAAANILRPTRARASQRDQAFAPSTSVTLPYQDVNSSSAVVHAVMKTSAVLLETLLSLESMSCPGGGRDTAVIRFSDAEALETEPGAVAAARLVAPHHQRRPCKLQQPRPPTARRVLGRTRSSTTRTASRPQRRQQSGGSSVTSWPAWSSTSAGGGGRLAPTRPQPPPLPEVSETFEVDASSHSIIDTSALAVTANEASMTSTIQLNGHVHYNRVVL